MLDTHEIPSLLHRRKEAQFALMCKVVHDLIPVLHQFDFLKPAKQRRKIKTPSHLKDYVADTTATDRFVYNHSKCYVVTPGNTDLYKHSFFFCLTVLDWNHLDGSIAECGSVEDFRSNLRLQLG